MSDTYFKITEKRKTSCFTSSMVQNIPGMLRVLSEAREIQQPHERLDVNVMVRLGAWQPIRKSTWEDGVKQSKNGQSKNAFAEINVGQNKAVLSDWLINDGRTEVTDELGKLLQCYEFSLVNGKLDQDRFAVSLYDVNSVEVYVISEQNPPKYVLRPASPDEAGLFYALPKEKDAELGTVGHLRADFGRHGTDFWTTWWPRGPEKLNSPEFKTEFDDLVNTLRENGPLQSFNDMRRYCREHGGEIPGGICTQNYGYFIETEGHRYALRCNPQQGDYNIYLTAFDLRVQEMNMRQEQQDGGMQMGGMNRGTAAAQAARAPRGDRRGAGSRPAVSWDCVDCRVPALRKLLSEAESLDIVCEIAAVLETVPEKNLPAYKALLEAEHFYSLCEALGRTDRLGEYLLSPQYSTPAELAEDELGFLLSERDAETLLPFVDLRAYGGKLMQRENLTLTEYGLIERRDRKPVQGQKEENKLSQDGMTMGGM